MVAVVISLLTVKSLSKPRLRSGAFDFSFHFPNLGFGLCAHETLMINAIAATAIQN